MFTTLLEFISSQISFNDIQQSRRTAPQYNYILQNFYIPKTSLVTNIFTKFTDLASLTHVQTGYEDGSFDRELTRGH